MKILGYVVAVILLLLYLSGCSNSPTPADRIQQAIDEIQARKIAVQRETVWTDLGFEGQGSMSVYSCIGTVTKVEHIDNVMIVHFQDGDSLELDNIRAVPTGKVAFVGEADRDKRLFIDQQVMLGGTTNVEPLRIEKF